MVTSLEGFRSSIVVSLRLQIKVGTSLLTVLYFPNSEKTPIRAVRRGAALPTTNNAAMRLIVSPSRGVWGGVSWFGFEILGYPQHFSGAAGLLKEKGF